MKIAVLGGSFDPPHIGHYFIVNQIAELREDIERIVLMPTYQHQWKPIQASAEDRLAMLGCFENKRIEVSDLEIRERSGKYTIDTIRKLKKDRNDDIYWIVGSDILSEWERWEKKDELLSLATFFVFPRDPFGLPKHLPKGFETVSKQQLITTSISSTVIRGRIKENKAISYLVPAEVEMYIKEKKLYL